MRDRGFCKTAAAWIILFLNRMITPVEDAAGGEEADKTRGKGW